MDTPTQTVGHPSTPVGGTPTATAFDPGTGQPVDGPEGSQTPAAPTGTATPTATGTATAPPTPTEAAAAPRFAGALYSDLAWRHLTGQGLGTWLGAGVAALSDTALGGPRFALGEPALTNDLYGHGYAHMVGIPSSDGVAALAAEVSAVGSAAGEHVGVGLTGADLDGDGLSDLVIGAPDAVDGSRAWLVLGTRLAGPGDVALGSAALAVLGTAGDYLGYSSAAADLDGDGHADVALGAPLWAGSTGAQGRVAVVLGRPSWSWPADGESLSPELYISGEEPGGFAGASVAAGVVGAPGLASVVVGVPGGAAGAGQVALFRGRELWPQALDVSDAELLLQGEAPGGKGSAAGMALAAGCDLDGDGRGDVLVGAPSYTLGGAAGGRVYLLTALALVDGRAGLGAADGIWDGGAAGDEAGAFVGCLGDLDGDGYDDAYAVAPGADEGRGVVHILYGRAGRWPRDGVLTAWDGAIHGARQGDGTGSAVAAVDLDGDGLAELAVGAPVWQSGAPGAPHQVGRVSIFKIQR